MMDRFIQNYTVSNPNNSDPPATFALKIRLTVTGEHWMMQNISSRLKKLNDQTMEQKFEPVCPEQ